MRDRPQAYEHELAEAVGTSTERWLTEMRLAVVGIAISVGLGAADIALGLGGWEVALAAGLGSTLVFVGLLWRLRPRALTRQTARMGLLRVSAALALGAALYARFLRAPVLTWGATEEEAVARLPGDELLEDADGVATRAVEIEAPPTAVWPWLAQMGPTPRGGAYTYDWIENLLGLGMHSADRVLPEFQHPEVGDVIGYGSNRMRVERVEPEQVLAWRSEDGNWVWTFVLEERDGSTRLISRNRFRLPSLAARLGMIPMEPASLVMERKMLNGIKQRAERLALSGSE